MADQQLSPRQRARSGEVTAHDKDVIRYIIAKGTKLKLCTFDEFLRYYPAILIKYGNHKRSLQLCYLSLKRTLNPILPSDEEVPEAVDFINKCKKKRELEGFCSKSNPRLMPSESDSSSSSDSEPIEDPPAREEPVQKRRPLKKAATKQTVTAKEVSSINSSLSRLTMTDPPQSTAGCVDITDLEYDVALKYQNIYALSLEDPTLNPHGVEAWKVPKVKVDGVRQKGITVDKLVVLVPAYSETAADIATAAISEHGNGFTIIMAKMDELRLEDPASFSDEVAEETESNGHKGDQLKTVRFSIVVVVVIILNNLSASSMFSLSIINSRLSTRRFTMTVENTRLILTH